MAEIKIPDSAADSLRQQFPSNSRMKEESPKKDRLEKVVSGEITIKKESIGKRIAKLFIAEDIQDVRRYVIQDILIPGAKTAMLSALEMLFFARTSGYYSGRPFDYNRASQKQAPRYSYSSSPVRQSSGPIYAEPSTSSSIKPIYFRSRKDAQVVYAAMLEQVERYGEVTVMQYYDLCGTDSNFSDDKWGWRDISRVRILPSRAGYILDLGSPAYLE